MDKNLTIRITGSAPNFLVVAESDASSEEGSLTLPFSLEELAGIVPGVEHARTVDAEEPPDTDRPKRDARVPGAELYARLFTGKVGGLLNQALGSAERGVRIRLLISTSRDDTARVAGLPWEILSPNAHDSPVACGGRTVLVRTIDGTDETKPLPFEPPLRILLVVANPKGTAPLDLAKERWRIEQAFTDVRGVELVTVETATKEEILDALATKPFHVLHFMGHGDFDAATGTGAVLLEQDDGTIDRVEADELCTMLTGKGLRVVFLNACKTATTNVRGAVNPFGGVATALMAAGIPAVIAMQFPISDDAAIKFSTTFYKRLVQGKPVDEAVAEGRIVLFGKVDSEWATPVLYLRPKHGRLFDAADGSARVEMPNGAAVAAAATGQGAPNATAVSTGGFGAYTPTPSTPSAPVTGSMPAAATSSTEFRVFLAASSATVKGRPQIIKDLKAAGITVLPAVPDPNNPDESEGAGHDARVREIAKQADLFVHVLGADPGEPLSDADAAAPVPDTFPLRQLALGAQLLQQQLVVVDSAAPINDLEDKGYREFLQRKRDGDRDRNELDFRVDRVATVAAAVIKKRDAILEERKRKADASRAASGPATAFIDVHMADYPKSMELIKHLKQRNVMPDVLPVVDDPTAADDGALDLFADKVRQSPLVILYYGNVAYEWITNRFELITKIRNRARLRTTIGLYVAPPAKSADDLNFAASLPILHSEEKFDADAVDKLLGVNP